MGTVGRDIGGPGLAARINDVIAAVGGEPSTFTAPEHAGHALLEAMAARGETLLVVDDVWSSAQLEPFLPTGVTSCRLLVTTRRPAVLTDIAAHRIDIEAIPPGTASQFLTRDLPAMTTVRERELLMLTGGWPLLLNLANRQLVEMVERRGADINTAVEDAARRLRMGGPSALDVEDSGKRETAVAATVDYSLEVLGDPDRDRFYELGIFGGDGQVPLAVVARLWRATAGLGLPQAESLWERLARLSLLTVTWANGTGVVVLHDVLREFALTRIDSQEQITVHIALIESSRVTAVHAAGATAEQPPGDDSQRNGTPWWRLSDTVEEGYLQQNLTYHLQAVGLQAELDRVCCDLRFLAVRLQRSGPAGAEADLARSTSPTADRIRRVITQSEHLLGPIEPVSARITTLTSRLGGIRSPPPAPTR